MLHLLLFLGQLHLHILVHGLILVLGLNGLLCSIFLAGLLPLLSCDPRLLRGLHEALPLGLGRLPALLSDGLRLLLRQHQVLHHSLILSVGLANDYLCDLPEHRGAVASQKHLPVRRNEVHLELWHDVVALQHRGEAVEDSSHAAIIQRGDVEAGLGLVVAVPGTASLAAGDAALHSPLHDLPVGELGVLRVLLDEAVNPVEEPSFGQADGEDHVALARRRLQCGELQISSGCRLEHPALEGERHRWLRAQVDTQRDVLVRQGGIQSAALESLRDCLRLAGPLAIFEEAHGEGVLARGVKVQENRICPTVELRGALGLLPAMAEVAIRVEADAVDGVSEEERGASLGKAEAHHIFCRPAVVSMVPMVSMAVMRNVQQLH
mmetsp:Transcript_52241/g.113220  ORF Transcript_52241/g.113220 Transcript_52241/m.113220 type:complete len:379 (-) Transcript_52241:485-1621(-)